MHEPRWAMLSMLDQADRRRVMALARRRRFDRNEVIFHQGDPGDTLHVVDNGHVALRSSTSAGSTATLRILGPGETFGEQALVRKEWARTATAVAIEPTETRVLHRDEFERLRQQHPSIDRFLVELLADRVHQTSAALLEAYFVPAEQRVLRRLVEAAEVFGPGPVVEVPLTQEDLAAAAGTTRPTANRALRGAEQDGLLTIGRGRVEVLDLPGLAHRVRM